MRSDTVCYHTGLYPIEFNIISICNLFCGDPLDDDDPYGSLTNGYYDYDHDE